MLECNKLEAPKYRKYQEMGRGKTRSDVHKKKWNKDQNVFMKWRVTSTKEEIFLWRNLIKIPFIKWTSLKHPKKMIIMFPQKHTVRYYLREAPTFAREWIWESILHYYANANAKAVATGYLQNRFIVSMAIKKISTRIKKKKKTPSKSKQEAPMK